MWKLDWRGSETLWQVRADGVYRLIGIGARPNEHWGRLRAARNEWVSEWEKGVDGGSYELRGDTWIVTGALGTGTWQRLWPARGGNATCPYVDIADIERHFAGVVEGRMIGNLCQLRVSRNGINDGVSITRRELEPEFDPLQVHRAACDRGSNEDASIVCVPDLGDAAFFERDSLHVYRRKTQITIELRTYPENVAVNRADEIALGKLALAAL
jgi:hypothetical protein